MSAPVDKVPLAQPVTPPPADVPIVQRVAEILLAGYAINKTLSLLAALLAPYKIGKVAIGHALGLAKTAHTPHAVLTSNGITPSRAKGSPATLARNAARQDVYHRAAYVIAASGRMQRQLDAGVPLPKALTDEARNFELHRQARKKRLDAAADIAKKAELHGKLLGWYRNPLLDSDIDCRVADGHNFDAWQGTSIGYPGSVHPNCGCSAGPPHEGAGMVDDALASTLGRLSTREAERAALKIKRAG